jgi:hypothetical protein
MDFHQILSYCGLSCTGCPIFWATLEPDEKKQRQMREKIASICNEQYGLHYSADDITGCDGCRTVYGRLFSGCRRCTIRSCAIFREVETCAHCPDYPCNILREHHKTDPTGKTWLEIVHATL